MTEMTSRDLYEGVQMRELKYESFAYGKNNAYALIIDSDAPVELKVSAGEWDENTTTDNPGEKFTVAEHSKRLADKGYEVLAITNAGFYDLNTTMTYIPWGMQIVDGIVKKEPNKDNPKNTDNWFGQTADGKYVISNTDGYPEYETKISDGVGGGLMLMKDGKPCFTGTTPDFRTVVGVTKDGDLVILTISGANYAVVTQAFMDMGLEMDCVLNLDGGGSTTLHARTEEGKLEQYICETPVERAVADAIAIVKKK
jgi:exopolysaccharide biosynthesis protein